MFRIMGVDGLVVHDGDLAAALDRPVANQAGDRFEPKLPSPELPEASHSLSASQAVDTFSMRRETHNVLWDGLVHAWLQDTMIAARARDQGIGTELVKHAHDGAKAAGCEYLHVDFEDHLRPFYFGACGFVPTNAGLLSLR